MFTKDNRRNVDIVEGDFVAFKNRVHEVNESIIDRQVAAQVYQPVLIERRLDQNEIDELISCRPWGYSFRIDSEVTGYSIDRLGDNAASSIVGDHNRQQDRLDAGLTEMDLRLSILKHIFDYYGPERGRSWMDIATNCGVIPLLINKETYWNVTAFDIFEQNIQKAKLLAGLSGDTTTKFFVADAYDYLKEQADASFDTISALGLFYHLSDPIGLLNLMYKKVNRMVIIDTIVHNFDFSGWIQTISRHVKYEHLAHANDTRKILELHPTFRGLVDALYQVGFERVIEVVPSPGLLDQFPSHIYKDRNRTFVLAFKNV